MGSVVPKLSKKAISDLRPADYNPRTITPEAAAGLRASLDRFGLVQPIIWNKQTGNVVGGHQRLDALRERGDTETEVVVVDLDPADERALNVALNNPAIAGDWTAALPDVLAEIKGDMPDVYAELKLDALELAELSGAEEEPPEPDPAADEVPEDVETRCKPGDVWVLGEHRLMCGDSTDGESVSKLMRGESAGFVFTDPPYGVDFGYDEHQDKRGDGYEKLMRGFWDIVSVMGCPVVMTPGNVNLRLWFSIDDFKTAYWVKRNTMAPSSVSHLSICEVILLSGVSIKRNTDLLEYPVRKQLEVDGKHPCPKLMDLVLDCIESWAGDAELLYEPFCGSGTTLIACEKTNRKCYAMEYSPKYCDVILTRWEEYTGKKAVKDG